ncbi:DUF5666 domain-containing protein [Helicobacter sp.]|uniref:DUF5666 domain-containing protein n=1 Tax=Helicobacter sp. TaxID=218 RepID=UPI0025BF3194|nr:DUF5666 domain-containing protein [Helicobacter sp.]MCI5968456.1 DUF5666 domain-containing protein [Helicobacter sp.]MDY2585241.1 DUF5666 domain-containing protein [Helicobacter sp.]
MFKKILIRAFILSFSLSQLLADSDIEIYGQITKIDNAQKIISLSSANREIIVQVLPHTKLKGDDCGIFGKDTREEFSALKTGMFVEVEALPQANGSLVAKSIEWECRQKSY